MHEVVAIAQRQLTDTEHPAGLWRRRDEQLVLLHVFGTREDRVPLGELRRRLSREGVQRVTRPVAVSTPRQRAFPPPRVAELPIEHRRGGGTVLVHIGL